MLGRAVDWVRVIRSRIETRVLIILCLSSGGAFAFLRLASEIVEGDSYALDDALLVALRTPADTAIPIGPVWLTKAFEDLTSLGGVTVLTLLTTLVVVFLALRRAWAAAAFAVLSIAGGWMASTLIKLGVARPRPDSVAHLVDVHDFSFPSGHAMVSAVTYLTLGALLARFEPVRSIRIFFIGAAVFLTMLIGISRVYLGVHYPTDVLGGWCGGAAWAGFCWLVARRFLRPQPNMSSPATQAFVREKRNPVFVKTQTKTE